MDVGEKLFSGLSGWLKRRNRSDRVPALLDEELPAVYLLSQASEHGALILAGDVFGSVTPEIIRLPFSVRFYKEKELNRFVLLHKALVAGAILRAGIHYPDAADTAWSRALAIELSIPTIQNELRKKFPAYDEWVLPYFQRLKDARSDLLLESDDRAWLKIKRNSSDFSQQSVAKLSNRSKRHVERIPGGVLCLWIELLKKSPKQVGRLFCGKPKTSQAPTSESRSIGGSDAQSVDLESQLNQDNPVSHSFEKLETAEEYKGGFRAADGSDQLNEHQQALEELRLDQVTRDGESAASQYSADLTGVFDHGDAATERGREKSHIFLPEWDYRHRRLKPDFCRLYLETEGSSEPAEAWLSQLKEKYADQIAHWEPRLWSLMNQRRCRDRELDGPDFSVDAAIRYFADSRHGGQADPRLFSRMHLQRRDYSVLLLLDQSLSTDSWIANRRVLDVELESIGLIGALTQSMREPVAIAGTWSETRNHCHFRTYKAFDEDWGKFYGSASKIEPTGYTRLGPALRHGASILQNTGAKRKLLIVLTDGKPTDFDRYEGRYGIEDIHHAFLEARQLGVTVKALTIESQARHYFPFLFGAGGYTILNDPSELPASLFKIYLEARGVA